MYRRRLLGVEPGDVDVPMAQRCRCADGVGLASKPALYRWRRLGVEPGIVPTASAWLRSLHCTDSVGLASNSALYRWRRTRLHTQSYGCKMKVNSRRQQRGQLKVTTESPRSRFETSQRKALHNTPGTEEECDSESEVKTHLACASNCRRHSSGRREGRPEQCNVVPTAAVSRPTRRAQC